jgi:hypothetical protein
MIRKEGKRWVVVDRRGNVISSHRTKSLANKSATHHIGSGKGFCRVCPSGKERAWRSRQRPEAIMHRRTFRAIEREAQARGYRNPKAVAGAAYWRTVRAKYRRSETPEDRRERRWERHLADTRRRGPLD